MENKLRQCLTELGCTDKEQVFFMACYKLGPSSVVDIAAKAKLQRSTAYLIAEQLIAKELVREDLRSYNRHITTVSAQSLINLLENKKRIIGRMSITLQDNLDELESLRTPSSPPKTRVYHGATGLLAIWKEILQTKDEILLWTNQMTEPKVFNPKYHGAFIAERVKKQIPIRVLAVNNEAGRALLASDAETLRETRLLPTHTDFTAEIYLCDNKLITLDFTTDIVGIIITNPSIYEAQKAIFELTWQQN